MSVKGMFWRKPGRKNQVPKDTEGGDSRFHERQTKGQDQGCLEERGG